MKKKFNTNSIYDTVVEESLARIEFYRQKKDNNIFDDFYHSHLDCMQELLEQCKEDMIMKYTVIICQEGHKYDSGETTPVYVTICKKPHWDSEGIMLQSGFYDATKFNPYDDDIKLILEYVRASFPDRKFCTIDIDKRILGSRPREVWSDIKGTFDEDKSINGLDLSDDTSMRKYAEDRLLKHNIREFHNSRKIFAIFDDKLNWCEKTGLSHHEWLVGGNIFCEEVFNDLVRGFEDEEGIYFYSGEFETNEYVEDMAKSWMNSISTEKPVYCGMIKGKVGEKWKPIKTIRE